jgi:hypothetical protein
VFKHTSFVLDDGKKVHGCQQGLIFPGKFKEKVAIARKELPTLLEKFDCPS